MQIYTTKPILFSIIDSTITVHYELSGLISRRKGIKYLKTYESYSSAIRDLSKNKPNVILFNIDNSNYEYGIKGIRIIKDIFPEINIIVLTGLKDEDSMLKALINGATGYILKDSPITKINEAIREAYKGGASMSIEITRKVIDTFRQHKLKNLTKRQIEVLNLLCQGKSYRAISDVLFIEVTTVKYHIKNIYKILKVTNKAQAIIKANDYRLA